MSWACQAQVRASNKARSRAATNIRQLPTLQARGHRANRQHGVAGIGDAGNDEAECGSRE
jgi:hypothetical protein